MSDTDCVGKLDLAFVGKTCCYDDILCYVTCCISRRTVYLCTVFSGESSAAVTSVSAVGVYDDLTSGEAGISVRSADYNKRPVGLMKNLVCSSTMSAGIISSNTYF